MNKVIYTHKLVRAYIRREVPLFDATGLITRDKFSLVGMNANIIDWMIELAQSTMMRENMDQEPSYRKFGVRQNFCVK